MKNKSIFQIAVISGLVLVVTFFINVNNKLESRPSGSVKAGSYPKIDDLINRDFNKQVNIPILSIKGKVDVFNAANFNKQTDTPVLSISDPKTLEEISAVFREAVKIQGILDVMSPQYMLEIYRPGLDMETIYLWLRKDSVQGMYMYKHSTHTGYSISEENTEKLKKIIIAESN